MTTALLMPAWLGIACLLGTFLGALVRRGDEAAAAVRTAAPIEATPGPARDLTEVGATT